VGLLEADRAGELHSCLQDCSRLSWDTPERPYVAVATREGMLVNQHLGEAGRFQIWGQDNGAYRLIEERQAPAPGGGGGRWLALAELLHDCRAVLVNAVGETPRAILEESGVRPVEMDGFIQLGLEAVFAGGDLTALKGRKGGLGRACCGGGRGAGPGGGCG
jgi:nitrogen fixation protein NifB